MKGAVKEVPFKWLLQRASDRPPLSNSVGYLIMTPNLYLMPIAPEANINARKKLATGIFQGAGRDDFFKGMVWLFFVQDGFTEGNCPTLAEKALQC